MVCAKCGSENVSMQVVQTSAKTRTRGRGLLWGLGRFFLILCTGGLWLLFGRSKAKSTTHFKNETQAVCQNCGNKWAVNNLSV